MTVETLKRDFYTRYKKEASQFYWAPGRINFIGEHIDYNGGSVLPFSIDLGTYLAVTMREDHKIRLFSQNFPECGVLEFSTKDIEQLNYNEKFDWANYPLGMLHYWHQQGYQLENGFDAYFYGTIPTRSGLSSSASIELVTSVFLNDTLKTNIDMLIQVLWAQQVENQFIGVNCGIMDQFAIGMGKKNHATRLQCDTLEYVYTPLDFGEYSILIMNTNKSRELAESAYNKRLEECKQTLTIAQQSYPLDNLAQMTLSQLKSIQDQLTAIHFARAKHVITEQNRVLETCRALENNDYQSVGELLNASHASLKEDYEVTGIELDTIVSLAQNQTGVLGARMTGAGFGGCAIALVKTDLVQNIIDVITPLYEAKIGYPPTFYKANSGSGAGLL